MAMRLAGALHRPTYEKTRFYLMRGWWPNLATPTSIAEYLVGRKLRNNFERPEIAGKVEGYAYAAATCPDLVIPQIEAIMNDDDPLPDLPAGDYIVKGSHGSGMVCPLTIAEDGAWTPTRVVMSEHVQRWLKTDYAAISGEWLYRATERCVIFERSLCSAGELALDVKIHCAKGAPRVVQFLDRTSGRLERFTWTVDDDLKVTSARLYRNEYHEPPAGMNDVLMNVCLLHARAACQGFDYIRVDFMVTATGTPVFAEMTYLPAGGCMPLIDRATDEAFFQLCYNQPHAA
jgi:hypothetical protein